MIGWDFGWEVADIVEEMWIVTIIEFWFDMTLVFLLHTDLKEAEVTSLNHP